MKAVTQMTIAQIKLLLRNRAALAGTIGLAIISMLVFGSLFGGNGSGSLQFGLVDQDNSLLSQQITKGLSNTQSLKVTIGNQDDELAALNKGERSVVLIIPTGFGASVMKGQQANLVSYVNKSDLVAASLAQQIVGSLADGVNRSITNAPQLVGVEQKDVVSKPLRNIDFLVPGFLGMMIMWANIYVGSAMIGWRERGILKRLSVTPVTPSTIIGTRVASQVLFSLLQAVIFIGMALAIYQVPIEGNLLTLAVMLFFGALAMMGIGFIVGSFVNKSESAGTVTQLIAFPMMFFGGSYFSVASAPQFMQPIIKAMPLTWLNEGLRQVFNQGAGFASSIVQLDLLVLFAWVAASLLVAVRLFKWQV